MKVALAHRPPRLRPLDGRRLALATNDVSRLSIWDFERPDSRPLVITGLSTSGTLIAFNHRGDLLATHGWEGVLRLWDPITGRQLLKMTAPSLLPRFSPDDRFLGMCVGLDSMQLLEVASGRELPGP